MAAPGSKADVAALFAQCDKDGNGAISCAELDGLMNGMGMEMSPEEIKACMAELDLDGNGTCSLEEFKVFMQKVATMMLVSSFQAMDADGNGVLSRAELKNGFAKCGQYYSDQEIDGMIAKADENNDGKIDYKEFVGSLN